MPNKLLMSAVLVVVVSNLVLARGAKVKVQVNGAEEFEGELLSVRDSAILIFTGDSDLADQLPKHLSRVKVIDSRRITRVTLLGKSKVLKGMRLGTLIGAGAGVLIGLASGDDPPCSSNDLLCFRFSAGDKAAILATALGGIGFVIGTTAGIIKSKKSEEVLPVSGYDFSVIKRHSRYADTEPDFLRKIGETDGAEQPSE